MKRSLSRGEITLSFNLLCMKVKLFVDSTGGSHSDAESIDAVAFPLGYFPIMLWSSCSTAFNAFSALYGDSNPSFLNRGLIEVAIRGIVRVS